MNTDLVQCQGCHGFGGYGTYLLEDGTGPWDFCGFCHGKGRTTKLMNSWIMRWHKCPEYDPPEHLNEAHLTAMHLAFPDFIIQ